MLWELNWTMVLGVGILFALGFGLGVGNGTDIFDWFKQKQKELLNSIGINPKGKIVGKIELYTADC